MAASCCKCPQRELSEQTEKLDRLPLVASRPTGSCNSLSARNPGANFAITVDSRNDALMASPPGHSVYPNGTAAHQLPIHI